MNEPTETIAEGVRRVANAILATGKLPSGRQVREQLGRGTMQTIYAELEKWTASLGKLQNLPPVPEGLQAAFYDLWGKAVAEADARHATVVTELREELRSAAIDFQALTEEAADLRQAHASALQQASEIRQRLENQVATLTLQLTEREKALEAAQAVLAQTQRHVDSINQQLAQSQAAADRAAAEAREFFQQESEKLAMRYRDMEDRVMAEADAVRQAAQRDMQALRETHKRDLAGAQQRLDQALSQLEATGREVTQRDQQLQHLTQENTRLLMEGATLRAEADQLKVTNKTLQDAIGNLKDLLPTKGKH